MKGSFRGTPLTMSLPPRTSTLSPALAAHPCQASAGLQQAKAGGAINSPQGGPSGKEARRTSDCHNALDKHVVIKPARIPPDSSRRAEDDDIAGSRRPAQAW